MSGTDKTVANLLRQVQELQATLQATESALQAAQEAAKERDEAPKESDAARQASQERVDALEAACRAREDFLAELSHEMRTPLSPVLLAASELERRGDLPAEAREQAGMIRRNVELAARLVGDLLDLTRISRGKLALDLQPLDMCQVLRQTVTLCRAEITTKNQLLTMDIETGKHFVCADPLRLQQIFANLLKNSIKFTPPGGLISVYCSASDRGRVRVEVTDSGMGIDPAFLGRLFEPFQQAGREVGKRHGGLGLGLAISRSLVQLHGGEICGHSAGTGKGATFTVELPAIHAPPSQPKPASPTPPQAAVPQTPLRILIVEDHVDSARTMARLLEADGHTVKIAGSVAAASEAAQKQHFDLLMCDLGLPDGSGLELMREFSQHYGLKGVAISGYGLPQDIERSRAAGFLEHVVKPIKLERLEEVIRNATRAILASRPAPPPASAPRPASDSPAPDESAL